MDPQYLKKLRDARSILDDGIFPEKEFQDHKVNTRTVWVVVAGHVPRHPSVPRST
jgi:hypothetical protein